MASSETHVVALCGSLREESRTRIVLQTVLTAARQAGAETALVDLRSYDLPSLQAVEEPVPDADALRKRVDAADSVVLGTPNYHGSFSGSLKNALDYCGREEFAGTTVGLVEVAAGSRPGSALVHLRTVTRTLHAWTLPTELAVPDAHSLVGDDGIDDAELADRARDLGRELVRYGGLDAFPQSCATAGSQGRSES